jgi:hypothetical protein
MSQISKLKGKEFADAVKTLYFEVIQNLANNCKSDVCKQYRLRYHDEDSYFKDTNIQLNKLKFKASNVYELWLKIYDYFEERNVGQYVYDKKRVCRTFKDNMTTYDDHENMEIFIQYEMSCYYQPYDYFLWWEEDV